MPIYTKDDVSILYIHIPKTGGTYLEHYFHYNGFTQHMYDGGQINHLRRCSPQHRHASILEQILDLSSFDLIFMTVRHPINRFRSEFQEQVRLGKADPDDLNGWASAALDKLAFNPYHLDNHLRPQHEFYIPGCTCFRQEDGFDAAWSDVMEARLGISLKTRELDRVRVSEPLNQQLSDPVLRRLLTLYAHDFTIFNYDPAALPATGEGREETVQPPADSGEPVAIPEAFAEEVEDGTASDPRPSRSGSR